MVSYETVRRWLNDIGPMIASEPRGCRPKPHATWHLDEAYMKIDGHKFYLGRAVDAAAAVNTLPDRQDRNDRLRQSYGG